MLSILTQRSPWGGHKLSSQLSSISGTVMSVSTIASEPNATLNAMPTEILSLIFFRVREILGTTSSVNCIQCCKRWHDIMLPILYRDIVVTNNNLEPFTMLFHKSPHSGLVRSMSIKMQPKVFPGGSYDDCMNANIEYIRLDPTGSTWLLAPQPKIWAWLRAIKDIIKTLAYLTSFSFTVSPDKPDSGFMVPGLILTSYVDVLPSSCTDLEVDSRGYDFCHRSFESHFCDAVRKNLPHLVHLRLRLRQLCSNLIVLEHAKKHKDLIDPNHSQFEEVYTPKLKSVLINSVTTNSFQKLQNSSLCHQRRSINRPFPKYGLSWWDVSYALLEADMHSRLPVIDSMDVIYISQQMDPLNPLTAQVQVRNVFCKDVLYQLPFTSKARIPGLLESLVCDTEETLVSYISSYPTAIEPFIEGRNTWVETNCGSRLAACTFHRSSYHESVKKRPAIKKDLWILAGPVQRL